MANAPKGGALLNFRQIEIFRAIMIAKTVNGASQMLNCSQPGLSRALKHMESKVGFALFNRANGRLFPTQEAIALLEQVQHLYRHVEQVNVVLARLSAGEDRVFRLGAPPSIGHSLVPAILRDLRKLFDALTIHFDVLPIEQVLDYLVFQRGEFAFTVYFVDHPNIGSVQIGAARMVCVLPQSHRLAGKTELSLHDLAGERLISYQGDTPHSQIIQQMYANAGVPYEVATYVRFAETALSFVEQDLGIAIVDEFTAMNLKFNAVRVLPLAQSGLLPIYLNRAKYMPRSTVSDAFENIAMRVFAPFRDGKVKNRTPNPRPAKRREKPRQTR